MNDNISEDFRPMRRFKQQLPDEECVAVLNEAYRGFLSVIGENGYPYAIPINFLYSDGHIYFHCALEGHKMDAVKANDKVCFTVIDQPVQEPGDWWYHVRSVICFGRIAVVDDDKERMRDEDDHFPLGRSLYESIERKELIGTASEYEMGIVSACKDCGYDEPVNRNSLCRALEEAEFLEMVVAIVPDPDFQPGGRREGQCDGWSYHPEVVTKEKYDRMK